MTTITVGEIVAYLNANLSVRDPIGAAIMRERAAQYVESPTHNGIRPTWPSDIRAIPLPTHTETLAYALQLPEIKALVDATSEARDKAMHWAARARVPECGPFAEIAQGLDAALAALEPKP